MQKFEESHGESGKSSQWLHVFFTITQVFWWETVEQKNETVKQHDGKISCISW